MKILMTGASGFIGKNLLRFLLNKGYEVSVLIRKNSDTEKIDTRAKIFTYAGDVELLSEYCKDESFNGLIHLASYFTAEHSKYDVTKLVQSNIMFATELLEASKEAKIEWFINTGTFWQHYENKKYSPVNLYAATKEAFEKIAEFYTQTCGLVFVTIKLNDTFGADDTRDKIFNLWHKISQTGEELAMSSGEQIIDISHVENIVSAYDLLIKHLAISDREQFKNKVFAIKAQERLSLRDLSKLYEEIAGVHLNIKWGAKAYREREVMLPWDDGVIVPEWVEDISLKEGIIKTLKSMNE